MLLITLHLVGCSVMGEQPDDKVIWSGYTTIVRATEVNKSDEVILMEGQRNYEIWRLGEGDIIVPPFATDATVCLPPNLQMKSEQVRGRRVSVRFVSKADRNTMIPATFIQWEGDDTWWVTTPDNTESCQVVQ